jgi:hypothetical protein
MVFRQILSGYVIFEQAEIPPVNIVDITIPIIVDAISGISPGFVRCSRLGQVNIRNTGIHNGHPIRFGAS